MLVFPSVTGFIAAILMYNSCSRIAVSSMDVAFVC